MANDLIRDSYRNCVLGGQHYLKGHFLEKDNIVKNGCIYKVNKKHFPIFLKESILYSFFRFYDTPYFTEKWGLCRYFDVCPQSTGITRAL